MDLAQAGVHTFTSKQVILIVEEVVRVGIIIHETTKVSVHVGCTGADSINECSVSRDTKRVRIGVLPSLLIVHSGVLDEVEAPCASSMVGCPVELIFGMKMVLAVGVLTLLAKLALRRFSRAFLSPHGTCVHDFVCQFSLDASSPPYLPLQARSLVLS